MKMAVRHLEVGAATLNSNILEIENIENIRENQILVH